jgi:hypothetical protein
MSPFIRQNTMMNKFTKFNKIALIIYRALPFILELKTFIDWTVTSTSMGLSDWIRFEDIHTKLFIAKCNSIEFKNKIVGEKIRKLEKIFVGGLSLVVILIILFGPMFLFSTFNPLAESNLVTGASVSFAITINRTNYFELFSNSFVINIQKADINGPNRDYSDITYFKTLNLNYLQVL